MLKARFFVSVLLSILYVFISCEQNPTSNVAIKEKSLPSKTSGLKIKGIIFSSEQKIAEEKKEGIVIENLEVFGRSDFIDEMEKFIGRPLDNDIVNEIKDAALLYFRKKGYPFVVIDIPAFQEVSSGIVHLQVIQSKVGKIEARGARFFSNEKLKKKLSVEEGDLINPKEILRDLVFINQNPFLDSSIYYKKSSEIDKTDLVLETKDKLPLRFYGGYDFSGYNVAGESRYFVGINIGSLYFVDHRIDYQYMFNPNVEHWQGHSAAYEMPLFFRTTFKAYGYYIECKPDFPTDGVSHGRSWMVAGKYLMPIIYQKFRSDAIVGYEFKRTNNFLTFIDETLYNHYTDISQFLLAYEGKNYDSFGKTEFSLYLYLSPGNMMHHNQSRFFQVERPKANSSYVYGLATINRQTNLYFDFTWDLFVKAQKSSARLLPSEEFSLGGYLTVRGYGENTIIGDDGILIKNELRTPVFSIFQKDLDFCYLLLFVDYGSVWEVDPNIENRKSSSLSSIGAGLRYNIKDYLTARFDYGFQLERAFVDHKRTSRAHVGVVLSY